MTQGNAAAFRPLASWLAAKDDVLDNPSGYIGNLFLAVVGTILTLGLGALLLGPALYAIYEQGRRGGELGLGDVIKAALDDALNRVLFAVPMVAAVIVITVISMTLTMALGPSIGSMLSMVLSLAMVPVGVIYNLGAVAVGVDRKPWIESWRWAASAILADPTGLGLKLFILQLLAMVGCIALGVGILLTAPMAMLATLTCYVGLVGEAPADPGAASDGVLD